MAVHYILDGYNIVKQIPALDLKNLRGSRDKLIRFIEVKRPQGSIKNKVTVVFDGKPGIAYAQNSATVEVLFSQNDSADDMMRTLVKRARHKKATVVVTDDKELRFSIRALGGAVMSVADFLARGGMEPSTPKRPKVGQADEGEEKAIPASVEYRINDELRKIWLNP